MLEIPKSVDPSPDSVSLSALPGYPVRGRLQSCDVSDRERVRLLLMADYLADPLWYRASSGVVTYMIRLESLPLSAKLRERLRAWASRYDALMETGYEWPNPAEEAAWVVDGRSLWNILRVELGPGYDVRYFYGADSGTDP